MQTPCIILHGCRPRIISQALSSCRGSVRRHRLSHLLGPCRTSQKRTVHTRETQTPRPPSSSQPRPAFLVTTRTPSHHDSRLKPHLSPSLEMRSTPAQRDVTMNGNLWLDFLLRRPPPSPRSRLPASCAIQLGEEEAVPTGRIFFEGRAAGFSGLSCCYF